MASKKFAPDYPKIKIKVKDKMSSKLIQIGIKMLSFSSLYSEKKIKCIYDRVKDLDKTKTIIDSCDILNIHPSRLICILDEAKEEINTVGILEKIKL